MILNLFMPYGKNIFLGLTAIFFFTKIIVYSIGLLTCVVRYLRHRKTVEKRVNTC
jgi:hypothetical protein